MPKRAKLKIVPFFDSSTSTWSYIVSDAAGRTAVIDPVLDFEPATGRISTSSADRIVEYTVSHDLRVDYLLETHVHADHLSAAQYLKTRVGGVVAIGRHVGRVQAIFAARFNAEHDFAINGSQFDVLLDEGDVFNVGELEFSVLHTPGHTPACITYVVGSAAFVGDTIFMPDYGTARTDFPGGDAGLLYDSIEKILALPKDTDLYLCHDYLPQSRSEHQYKTSVRAARESNIQLQGKSRDTFIRERCERDSKLAAPRLLLPSIQVNMRAGHLPPAESNDAHYLKIPLQLPPNATWA